MRKFKMTLNDLARKTGYRAKTLKVVASRAGVKLRRPGKRVFAISEEEAAEIIAELRRLPSPNRVYRTYRGEWGTCGKAKACVSCGSSERPYWGRHMCQPCYQRARSQGKLHEYKALRHGCTAEFVVHTLEEAKALLEDVWTEGSAGEAGDVVLAIRLDRRSRSQ